jgi:muramidase (phage lysozyme)
MASRLERVEPYLNNPNVRRYLDMISAAEATQTHGYRTAFGGGKIAKLDDHPRVLHAFTQTDGKKNKTGAAGRYQITLSTWDDVSSKLGLKDFSPRSQDLVAIELLRRAGALDAVANADWQTAIARSGGAWASLPSSTYPQKRRSMEFVMNQLNANTTGVLAGGPPPAAAPSLRDMTALPSWLQQLPPMTPPAQTAATPPAASPAVTAAPVAPGVSPAVTAAGLIAPPSVPATAPGAVNSLIAALSPAAAPEALGPIDLPEPSEEDDQALADGLRTDVGNMRERAVADFFGEDFMPDMPLPEALDKSINRYLALL